jgi:hypothetical protein
VINEGPLVPAEIGLELETEPAPAPRCSSLDDELAWMTYAQAAIPALLRADSSPSHVAERASLVADAMLQRHKERFP